MTKQQAIQTLKSLGVTDIVPDGKFLIWATCPSGYRGLFDPRELVAELCDYDLIGATATERKLA